MSQICEVFKPNRLAFMPFLPAGDPDIATTTTLLHGLADAGADLIEVGFPFSDPIADGPVIQAAYTRALSQGVRVKQVFDAIDGVAVPVVGMASYSLIHRIGVNRFLDEATSRLSGLIVPDITVDSAEGLSQETATRGIDLILLVTPTTPDDRARRIASMTRGFLYCVSVTGVTGTRTTLPADTLQQLDRLRQLTDKPLALGFGLSTPEQITTLHGHAHGAIVGSALVRCLHERGTNAMLALAKQMAAACRITS